MEYDELEVLVTLASAHDRRQVWLPAEPGLRIGRRLRSDHPSEPLRWWRVIEIGQMRLRMDRVAS
ncbi:MAG: hypothetical protein HKN94_16510 [Acidimicrobiales bacterium]|nr:hypothetical protein [Acidimicrobiales bacterium]